MTIKVFLHQLDSQTGYHACLHICWVHTYGTHTHTHTHALLVYFSFYPEIQY